LNEVCSDEALGVVCAGGGAWGFGVLSREVSA